MIEDLLSEISDRGFRLNNLFQLDSDLWQANLRSETHHTSWAQADSPALALALALDKIETAIESETQRTEIYLGPAIFEPTKTTGEVLRMLLDRPQPTCDRRI